MLKALLYVFSFIFFILAIAFGTLFYGINLKNISYQEIKIDELSLKYEKGIFVHIVAYGLEVDGIVDIDLTVNDVNFIFEKHLPPLKAKALYVKYKQDKVLLNFDNPTCDGIKIDGSFATIFKDSVNITLKSKALLQDELLKILKFYGIDLPLYQTSGENTVFVELNIPLSKTKTQLTVLTTVKSTNTNIIFNNMSIPINNLLVELKDDFVKIDANITQVDQNIFITNKIDLTNKISNGLVNINNFKYENLLDIQNEVFKYDIKFKNNLNIKVDNIDAHYTLFKYKHQLKIDNLNKVLEFIPIFDINNSYKSDFILTSDDDFNTTYVDIDNLHMKIYPIENNSSEKLMLPRIYCNLKNGSLSTKEYVFNYDTLKIDLNESLIDVKLVDQKSILTSNIDINTKEISIESDKLTDKFVNKILKKDILEGGYISLSSKGTFDNLAGNIKLYGTTVKDVQILNTLILFINTTPAIINPILALPTLLRLGETNFDMQGYHIQKGLVNFKYDMDNQLVNIPVFYTENQMMNFEAKANIDLNKRKINADIDVIFMKDHSKLLNKTPIIGYIITGEDGNFVTQVHLYGSLDNPKFEMNTVGDVSTGVINIFKRTLGLPFKLINNIYDENLTKKEEQKRHKDVVDSFINKSDF